MTWTLRKAQEFVALNFQDEAGRYQRKANEIARRLGCSTYAIQGMRRKQLRLAKLGVATPELMARMLLVSEPVVFRSSLRQLEKRIRIADTVVPHFLRRGRVTGKVHVVTEHTRARLAQEA